MELNTPEEIPYSMDTRMRPGAVEAAKMQKQSMALRRHVMNKRFRGP